MKIHELIKILESHPNPEADVNLIFNIVDIEDPEHDVNCPNMIVLRTDDFYEDFIELFASDKEIK